MSYSLKTVRRSCGFTLVELLVVMAIFSLLALMSYRGLGAVLDARAHVNQETEKWRHVEAFFSRFERDVHLTAPRPIRMGTGIAPAWRGEVGEGGSAHLEFSRFSSTDGGDALQRIAYTLNKNHEIELWLWPSLDVAPGAVPARFPVLAGVKKFELRYLDAGLLWVDAWPALFNKIALPRAIQLRLVLVSGEEIMRVFAL